uniref:Ig-like domain-containing protein n=1 Tax=Erpetoichthys calabaricus TaxID=27687 RepID=A0A8C4ST71_ERPCA
VFLSDFIVCLFISAVDCLIAFIGKMVEIPCNLITTESLKVEDILVEWTISGGLIVHSFVKGENNLMNQDPQFEGRTRLILSDLSRGDFSLCLSDVSIGDEGRYECSYQRAGETSSRVLDQHYLHVTGKVF